MLKSSRPIISIDLDFVLKTTLTEFEDEAIAAVETVVDVQEDIPEEAWKKWHRWYKMTYDREHYTRSEAEGRHDEFYLFLSGTIFV